MEPPLWMEIEVELVGAEVRITARGSRRERATSHTLGSTFTCERLESFTRSRGHTSRPAHLAFGGGTRCGTWEWA